MHPSHPFPAILVLASTLLLSTSVVSTMRGEAAMQQTYTITAKDPALYEAEREQLGRKPNLWYVEHGNWIQASNQRKTLHHTAILGENGKPIKDRTYWLFRRVVPGAYTIKVRWTPIPDGATNAKYAVVHYKNKKKQGMFKKPLIDLTKPPTGTDGWETIGTTPDETDRLLVALYRTDRNGHYVAMEAKAVPAVPECGNGVRENGEECDEGVINSDTLPDVCRLSCSLPYCGDNVQDSEEECDDGNTVGGDGCTADCREEICGDFVTTPNEQCDDGNTIDNDGCSSQCLIEQMIDDDPASELGDPEEDEDEDPFEESSSSSQMHEAASSAASSVSSSISSSISSSSESSSSSVAVSSSSSSSVTTYIDPTHYEDSHVCISTTNRVWIGDGGCTVKDWLDPFRGTVWSKETLESFYWDSAVQYCEDLEEGGRDDWTLPEDAAFNAITGQNGIAREHFNWRHMYYWTNTPKEDAPGQRNTINVANGSTAYVYTHSSFSNRIPVVCTAPMRSTPDPVLVDHVTQETGSADGTQDPGYDPDPTSLPPICGDHWIQYPRVSLKPISTISATGWSVDGAESAHQALQNTNGSISFRSSTDFPAEFDISDAPADFERARKLIVRVEYKSLPSSSNTYTKELWFNDPPGTYEQWNNAKLHIDGYQSSQYYLGNRGWDNYYSKGVFVYFTDENGNALSGTQHVGGSDSRNPGMSIESVSIELQYVDTESLGQWDNLWTSVHDDPDTEDATSFLTYHNEYGSVQMGLTDVPNDFEQAVAARYKAFVRPSEQERARGRTRSHAAAVMLDGERLISCGESIDWTAQFWALRNDICAVHKPESTKEEWDQAFVNVSGAATDVAGIELEVTYRATDGSEKITTLRPTSGVGEVKGCLKSASTESSP